MADKNAWKPLCFVTFDEMGKIIIRVEYKELGTKVSHVCTAVFENDLEYKLLAPWLGSRLGSGLIIQKETVSEFKALKMAKNQ
jgi:hypothetical protein